MDEFDDDDFGELYADVELQACSAITATATALPALRQLPHTITENLLAPTNAKGSVLSPGESTRSAEDSESEGELNIVLNDGDCDSAAGNGGGSDDVGMEGADDTHKRPCSSVCMTHPKACASTGLLLESNGEGCSKENSCLAATARVHAPDSSIVPQSGHYFSLPRHRCIFDVNVVALREKPWRYPGVDITDFFNFGLDEESWKAYCRSLEQLRRHTSSQTMVPNFESSKLNKVYGGIEHGQSIREVMADGVSQTSAGPFVSFSRELMDKKAGQLSVLKGRAIKVEQSSGERKPSMILGHAPSYDDSDVVIQIALQDCLEGSSSLGKEEVKCLQSDIHDMAENRELGVNGREVSPDCLEENAGRSIELSSPERYSGKANAPKLLESTDQDKEKISMSNDGLDHINIQNSDGNAEELERENETNEVVHETISGMMDNEASLLERTKLSLSSSLFESDSESSEDSFSVDFEKDHAPLERSSPGSCNESPKSIATDFADSAARDAEVKQGNGRDNLRNRSMIRRDKDRSWRHENSRDRKRYALNDDIASPSYSRGLSQWNNLHIGCTPWNESRHDIDHFDRECSSYYNSKSGCEGERLDDNRAESFYRGLSSRKGHLILRDNTDPYIRRDWRRGEINNDGSYRDGERDCFTDRESKRTEQRDPFSYWNTWEYGKNHFSYNYNEADSPSRMDVEDNQLYKRDFHDDRFWEYECEDYSMRYFPSRDRERGSLGKNYIRQLPSSREVSSSGRTEGYRRRSTSVLDGSWDIQPEDGYGDFLDHEPLSSHSREPHVVERRWDDSMSSRERSSVSRPVRRYELHPRPNIDEGSNYGLSSGYNELDDLGGTVTFPDDDVHLVRGRYTREPKFCHWSENELHLGHSDDQLWSKEASLYPRRNSRYAVVHDKYKIGNGILEGDMQTDQHRYTPMREEHGAFRVNRGFHVVDKIKYDQSNSRDSVDYYVREGKSSGRFYKGRNLRLNGIPENMNLKRAMNRTAFVEKAASTTKSESHQHEAKWVDKFPITEPNEDLDIEEGQIVPEESVPEKPMVKKKRFGPEKVSKNDEVASGLDDKRLLEALAKMERRRERFKESITDMKETKPKVKNNALADGLSKENTLVDTLVEVAEIKLERPARKRQWRDS